MLRSEWRVRAFNRDYELRRRGTQCSDNSPQSFIINPKIQFVHYSEKYADVEEAVTYKVTVYLRLLLHYRVSPQDGLAVVSVFLIITDDNHENLLLRPLMVITTAWGVCQCQLTSPITIPMSQNPVQSSVSPKCPNPDSELGQYFTLATTHYYK